MYELIKKLCNKKGISPTKLCTEITGSKGNLPTWQKGNINPTSLTKIADYFGCSVDYLLGRTNNPNMASDTFTSRDGIQAVSKDSSHFTFNHVDDPQDENQEELLKRFKMLDYEDKIEIMQMIIQKTKMKGNK